MFSWARMVKDALLHEINLPAPVVPPARVDERTVGDWWMVKSRSARVSDSVVALGSMKPRFEDGIS